VNSINKAKEAIFMHSKKRIVKWLILSSLAVIGLSIWTISLFTIEDINEQNTTEFTATVIEARKFRTSGGYLSAGDYQWRITTEEYGVLTMFGFISLGNEDYLKKKKKGSTITFTVTNNSIDSLTNDRRYTVIQTLRTENEDLVTFESLRRDLRTNNNLGIILLSFFNIVAIVAVILNIRKLKGLKE
jgi:hypothetical protein